MLINQNHQDELVSALWLNAIITSRYLSCLFRSSHSIKTCTCLVWKLEYLSLEQLI